MLNSSDVRSTSRLLIKEALGDPVEGGEDPSTTALKIEQELYLVYNGSDKPYKDRVRALAYNFKIPSNSDLRTSVMRGEWDLNKLCTVPVKDLASPEQKIEREKKEEFSLQAAIRGNDIQAVSDMFRCGKCKETKCTYYQLQIRSADEPMTTFITCLNCGSRWKQN